MVVDSMRSPELLFPVDVYESPDTDLRSSSVCVGDKIGEMTSTTSDIERSIGESVNRRGDKLLKLSIVSISLYQPSIGRGVR